MKRLILLFITAFLLMSVLTPCYAAWKPSPTDEITNYVISIAPREDGTLDIAYHLEWRVLDDEKEGPLTWVKVGIPNEHTDDIAARSDTIKTIRYLRDGGDYVRIDLDRAYKAGETVVMDFQLHQSSMYTLNQRDQTVIIPFTPGWFDNIAVKALRIRWEKKGAVQSNAGATTDTAFLWEAALKPGEKLTAQVIYPMDALKVTAEGQTKKGEERVFPIWGALLIATGILMVFYWLARLGGGYRGGFGGGHGSGVSRGCVCACACACGCACACACAGGGRAGCSAKPFFRPTVSSEELQKALRGKAAQLKKIG